jgi:hypothetical protein
MKSFRIIIIRGICAVLFVSVSTVIFSQTNQKNDTTRDRQTEPAVIDMQFSILPYVSINRPSTDEVVNLSFNLLAGYIKEVRVFEIGSIANIESANAGTCQIAGVANIVGGTSTGFQAAGVLNTSKSQQGCQVSGVLNLVEHDAGQCQAAGVGNIVGGSVDGVQVAGVINTCKSFSGVQIGGVVNLCESSKGNAQISGVGNLTGGSFEGVQITGVVNIADTIKGAQISGVLNATREASGTQIAGVVNIVPKIEGTQIAGVANISNQVEGLQLSGCVNLASHIKGVQISTVNIADSCDGIPIGVFSYARNGYHKIEISVDEVFYTNAAFKTGVKCFYNIFLVGIRPGNFENPLWTFGYGVGTKFGTKGNISFDLELSWQHISKGRVLEYLSELNKVYFGVEKNIGANSSLALGVTYNAFVTDTDSPQYAETFSSLAPYHFTNSTHHHGINIKRWIGGRVAFRFL